MLSELRRITADMIPGRFGIDEYVLLYFDPRITVDATKRHTMDLVTIDTTQR